ncbi:hypothetical protein CYMTET_33264 [Cymbomonas tetramitiformis]|uniref:DM8 domain-containing protein n=1 Tax=Cymbomonas tetramitiformis TaxID=36881 RepID=A0AAE0KRD3_9CHLO|nr:hypothetical protein CYMTET_33264 [Cymbomonas tetramitiformis]
MPQGSTVLSFDWNLLQNSCPQFNTLQQDLKADGGSEVCRLLAKAANAAKGGDSATCERLMGIVKQVAWEKLHTGHWKDVRVCWRDLYSVSSIATAAFSKKADSDSSARTQELLRELDLAVLMGGPAYRSHVDAAIATLHVMAQRKVRSPSRSPC